MIVSSVRRVPPSSLNQLSAAISSVLSAALQLAMAGTLHTTTVTSAMVPAVVVTRVVTLAVLPDGVAVASSAEVSSTVVGCPALVA